MEKTRATFHGINNFNSSMGRVPEYHSGSQGFEPSDEQNFFENNTIMQHILKIGFKIIVVGIPSTHRDGT